MNWRALLLCLLFVGVAHAALVNVSGSRLIAVGEDGGDPDPEPGDGLLSWSAPSNATGYKIYWSDNDFPGPSYPNSEDVGNVTSASPEGFDLGDPARVRAYDASGIEGPWSDEINTPTCDLTLTTSSNLPSAVASAANNSVICLSDGNYGTKNLWDISRSGWVTIRSLNGAANVTINPSIGNTDYVRIEDVTLTNPLVNSCSFHIQFINSVVAEGGSMSFDGSNCPNSTHDYLVDGVVFVDGDPGVNEGRLALRDVNGMIIQNSHFEGPGGSAASDGIHLSGSSKNVIIRGNTFVDILQGGCDALNGAHCDSIQFQGSNSVTVEGNYFYNVSTAIMSPDGCDNITVRHNIFNGGSDGNEYKIQFGSCDDVLFEHNTMWNTAAAFDAKTGNPASKRAIVRNNVWAGTHGWTFKTSNGGGCDSCSFTYNQGTGATSSSGCTSCTFSNNSSTAPTFSGGSPPSTIAGYALATGSAGKGTASDGSDRGTHYRRPAAPEDFGET